MLETCGRIPRDLQKQDTFPCCSVWNVNRCRTTVCVCGGRRNVYLGKRKMANTSYCAQQTFCACHERQRSIYDSNEYSALFQCAEGTLINHHGFKKSTWLRKINKLQNQDIKRTKIQKKRQKNTGKKKVGRLRTQPKKNKQFTRWRT